MRLSAIISALVLAACGGLSGYAWTRMPAEVVKPPPSGMDVLRDYKCRRSETKQIIVRGVEDNHSPAGNEPYFIRPDRMHPDTQSFFAGGSYDQVQADRRLTDSFKVPTNVARGLFLMRLKPVANNETDTFGIGDMSTLAATEASRGRGSGSVVGIEKSPGWSKQSELHFAELGAIQLRLPATKDHSASERTLLDYIQSGENNGWVDYAVQDDTSVDFAGMALCLEPPRGKGLTLAPFVGEPIHEKGLVALSCVLGARNQPICDPYVGDTLCSARLPVACFHPLGKPVPISIAKHVARAMWSGGRLAFTEPIAGSSFASAKEVDALCVARFGSDWRAAKWHDGPNNYGIAGLSDQAAPQSRVWIDVVGSPYATCWAR